MRCSKSYDALVENRNGNSSSQIRLTFAVLPTFNRSPFPVNLSEGKETPGGLRVCLAFCFVVCFKKNTNGETVIMQLFFVLHKEVVVFASYCLFLQ